MRFAYIRRSIYYVHTYVDRSLFNACFNAIASYIELLASSDLNPPLASPCEFSDLSRIGGVRLLVASSVVDIVLVLDVGCILFSTLTEYHCRISAGGWLGTCSQ